MLFIWTSCTETWDTVLHAGSVRLCGRPTIAQSTSSISNLSPGQRGITVAAAEARKDEERWLKGRGGAGWWCDWRPSVCERSNSLTPLCAAHLLATAPADRSTAHVCHTKSACEHSVSRLSTKEIYSTSRIDCLHACTHLVWSSLLCSLCFDFSVCHCLSRLIYVSIATPARYSSLFLLSWSFLSWQLACVQ